MQLLISSENIRHSHSEPACTRTAFTCVSSGGKEPVYVRKNINDDLKQHNLRGSMSAKGCC
ncbi:TPA: hypothetical protein MIG64_17525 [Klebsiella pneumoniae]|nr:hypothetical protein [Klebsiella variicola]MYM03384.1 hypothetical protein [Klebsiella pneumoniae]HBX7827262.1 hypothetical protein [Klebsiella pneumoniae]HBX7838180.1 hypothetical protein [Klebsiella pneumoniae]